MKLKKIGRFLFSMKFALIILLVLLAACFLGSIIPQGETDSYYTENYAEKAAEAILLLDLDDVFHSVWFIVITAFLCLNLLGCNLVRLPQVLRQYRSGYSAENMQQSLSGREADAEMSADPAPAFEKMRCSKVQSGKTADGRDYRYAVRNRIGGWGAWLTHLAMLIIIVGFTLGQVYTVKYTVYGVPGQTKQVGDTGYTLTIDDFSAQLREDETVVQYISQLTMTDTATGETQSGETSVNHPANLFGMKLYQNSTGWAASVLVYENGEPLQGEVLCAGEYLTVEDLPDLVIAFSAFYPDYTVGSDGMPATASSQLNNPAYLYSVYYQGSIIGMNVLTDDDYITIDDYTVVFTDPQQYSLIQLKHDPFTGITLVGGILICIALFIAFYMRTEELLAIRDENGIWQIFGSSRKGGLLYRETLQERAEALGAKIIRIEENK